VPDHVQLPGFCNSCSGDRTGSTKEVEVRAVSRQGPSLSHGLDMHRRKEEPLGMAARSQPSAFVSSLPHPDEHFLCGDWVVPA
jgi:hypothetical protein